MGANNVCPKVEFVTNFFCVADSYDKQASRYQNTVFLKKREQLVHQLQTEMQKIIDAYLTHVRHQISTESSLTLDLLFCPGSADPDLIGGLPKLECWTRFAEITWVTSEIFLNRLDVSLLLLRFQRSLAK